MKRACILLLCAAALCVLLCACGKDTAEVSFESYKEWLAEAFVERSPDPDGIQATLDALGSWDEVDLNSPPWDMFFSDSGYNASTWEEFVAAGGIGTFNEDVELPAASGEPSADPAA